MKNINYSSSSIPFLLRIIVGVLFIYSALWKIENPIGFYFSVLQYQLLSETCTSYVAITIPWVELLSGVFLVLNIFVPYAICLSIIVISLFSGAQIAVLLKGLTVHCGCFAPTISKDTVNWLTVFRNLVLLALCFSALGSKVRINKSDWLISLKQKLALFCSVYICIVGVVISLTFNHNMPIYYPSYTKSYSPGLMNTALVNHKEVVLLFVDGKCEYCPKYFEGPLRDRKVIRRFERITCLVINKQMENNVDMKNAIIQYKVSLYPTMVFMDKNGNVRSELIGYHTADDIIKSINELNSSNFASVGNTSR